MVSMMKDVVVRGTASGSVWSAGFHVPSGGKTGTTNADTDVWYIGYTADLVAGVWMGFDQHRKIKANAQGGQLAAPAFTTFMTEVYRRKPPPPDWPRPEGIVTREIDRSTAALATPSCPRDLVDSDFFIAGTEPARECEAHVGYPVAPGYPLHRAGDTLFLPPSPGRGTPGAVALPPPSRPGRDSGATYRLPPRLPRDTGGPPRVPPR